MDTTYAYMLLEVSTIVQDMGRLVADDGHTHCTPVQLLLQGSPPSCCQPATLRDSKAVTSPGDVVMEPFAVMMAQLI